MAHQLEQQLFETGKKLQHPPHSKDVLLKILKQAASYLSEVDQSPSEMMLKAMSPSMDALVSPELLRHRDRDVRLLVTTCISEITRITAPEAPYSDDVLKDIFHLIVGTFQGLDEINSPSFGRRVTILETVAKIRSCVVMLDLECDDLILEMFQIFFAVASDDLPENVITSMQTIMTLVLDESEDIPEQLLATLLAALGKEKGDVSPASRRLAMNVVEHCAVKLEPYVNHFIASAMSAVENAQSVLGTDYHEIIYDIYQCAPQMLQTIIPNMTEELLTDQLDVRLKSVKLLGRIFTLPGHPLAEVFRPLFSEFLKRFTDKSVEVRLSVVEHAKECLLSNPFRPEASDIISALSDRLLDYDENVRKHVVAAICDVANYALKSIPIEAIRLVAERLRDKAVLVRKYTLERLADVYRVYCLKCLDGSITNYEFEWIPGKIIRCCYDKDFRPQAIEVVFSESLFPSELSVAERVKHWIMMFSEFGKFEVKAFEGVLAQKQRLQQEMQNYLLLRQKVKEDNAPDLQKRLLSCFKTMSGSFKDPEKAEEGFQKLNQMKDNHVWKALTSLLDPGMTFFQAQATRIDLLKRLGDKHPQYEFIRILATKCSYLLFGKEHVKEMLKEIAVNKSAGKDDLIHASMNLLVLFAGFSPLLVKGTEGDLLQLLKEDNECIKEGIVHILARVGGSIQEQVTETTSSVDLLLETLCLEGSRKQAKYAVQALAAITKDAGLKALSVLYKRLVDMLESGTHLPAILQSLGCIAQNAMPVFETREEDVVQFVCDKLLPRSSNPADVSKTEWEERSVECLLKIYGIKTLVKSYLPNKDAHLRQNIKALLGILGKLLTSGEISKDVVSSEVDKAHLRLAAAKSVLRLSRHWDSQISPDLFYLTLRIAQDTYPEVRKEFIVKVHQYLKVRTLDPKYACALVLGISGVTEHGLVEVRQYLVDFVETCRREAQLRQSFLQPDGNSLATFPEYVLVYLVHALAHHPEFPVNNEGLHAEAFESFYRQLHLFLSVLVHEDDDGHRSTVTKEQNNIAIIMAIFQTIKHAEDAVEKSKSENLYTLCDIGLSITKDLVPNQLGFGDYMGSISLPEILYKPYKESEGMDLKAEGSHLPACLTSGDVFQSSNTDQACQSTLDQKWSKMSVDETVAEEDDKEDFEEPLRKMMKNAKLQGTRKKNHLGDKMPSETVNLRKGCSNEISDKSLGVTRIDSDKFAHSKSLETDKPSGQVMNGMDNIEGEGVPDQAKVGEDKQIGSDTEMLFSPKRKRARTSNKKLESSMPSENQVLPEDFTVLSELSKVKRRRMKGPGGNSDAKKEIKTQGLTMVTTEGVPVGLARATLKPSKLSTNNQKSEQNKDSVPKVSRLDASDGDSLKAVQTISPGSEKVSTEDATPNARQEVVHRRKKKSIAVPESVAKSSDDTIKTPRGTARKPLKRKSISGLEKSLLEKVEKPKFDYEKLAGYRIKVWWPLDKQFYEGIVQSYDSVQKKHKILYDDGDVEVLRLQKERWELINAGSVPEKLVSTSVANAKFTGAMPGKKGTDIGDTITLEEKQTKSSHKRKALSRKITKKSKPKSHPKADENGVLAKRTEVDSSGVKAADPFVFTDDTDQPAGCTEGKQKLGGKGRKGSHFTISGAVKDPEEMSTTVDDEKRVSLSDSTSCDSDDEPLNVWRLRTGKMR